MIKKEILLQEIREIQQFNMIAGHCVYDVDLQQGKYIVDAKSIMGIFSLNLERPILLMLNTDDVNELEKFKKYIFEQ